MTDDMYAGYDDSLNHSEDHPKDVDEEAIRRAMALTLAAQNEVRKMESKCICFPYRELYEASDALDDAFAFISDVAIEGTDLDRALEPPEIAVQDLMDVTEMEHDRMVRDEV